MSSFHTNRLGVEINSGYLNAIGIAILALIHLVYVYPQPFSQSKHTIS